MKVRALLGNLLWALSTQPARWRLIQALQRPEQAQRRTLQRLLSEHAESDFGKQHRFSELHTVQDFQTQVPLSNYEALTPWLEQAMAGEKNVLAMGEIRAFERTSGSTSAAKHIPCTASSMAEIHEAVSAWMGDLFVHHPGLLAGPSWWIISALTPSAATSGGIPVGLSSDLDYLSDWERALARWIFVQTPALRDLDTSLDEVASALASEDELRLISVWNPSLLLLLKERLPQVWPKLTAISAWADGWAAADADKVKRAFPQAHFQAKGLLATEGVVTIPWGTGPGAVPALHSHFLEFLDSEDRPKLVYELTSGETYEVVISTSAGLWRYRLGDLVRVVGWEGATPRLQFVGRADGVCDLRGEKLHPVFVAEVLSFLKPSFALLAPLNTGDGYGLITSATVSLQEVEQRLSDNPHYAHCRKVGQLQPLRLFRVRDDAATAYLARCNALGQRASTIKGTSLHAKPGWEEWFELQ